MKCCEMPGGLKIKIKCPKPMFSPNEKHNDDVTNGSTINNKKTTIGTKRRSTYAINSDKDLKRLKLENIKIKCNGLPIVRNENSSNNETSDSSDFGKLNGKLNKKVDRKIKESFNDHITIPALSCTVSINETYQLGFTKNPNDNEIYIFDFVDGLEVSYPVTVSSADALPEHLPPLFSEPDYADQLMNLATNALESLALRIDQWLCICQEAENANFAWRSIAVYNASSSLRRQIFTLLTTLVPDTDISDSFDCTSPDVDRLLYRLIAQLSSNSTYSKELLYKDRNTPVDAIPIVSLCHEPEHCLRILRERILTLLHLMLPELELPAAFNIEADLPDLIDAVYSYNPQSDDIF